MELFCWKAVTGTVRYRSMAAGRSFRWRWRDAWVPGW
jgi:hypothetical protein